MNIFEIEQTLLDCFEELENNGGELTPELEQTLAITQESFKDKVKNYADVIKTIDIDLAAIKCEEARLKKIKDSKTKTRERISDIIAKAITMFGDTTKSGGKFVDFGTGKISVRNSTVVNIDDSKFNLLEKSLNYDLTMNSSSPIENVVNDFFEYSKTLDKKQNELMTAEYDSLDESSIPNNNDIECATITFITEIPLNDVEMDIDDVRRVVQLYGGKCKLNVNKTKIKEVLLKGGSSNLCSVQEKQSITIK